MNGTATKLSTFEELTVLLLTGPVTGQAKKRRRLSFEMAQANARVTHGPRRPVGVIEAPPYESRVIPPELRFGRPHVRHDYRANGSLVGSAPWRTNGVTDVICRRLAQVCLGRSRDS